MKYISDFEDLNSAASKDLISILSREVCRLVSLVEINKSDHFFFYNWSLLLLQLSDICRRADPQNFRDVKIIRLL